ncbi:leucine-rich repeat-containing protein 23-like [Agrilus planipennis]|uniref:Leucine-rich repeat-containing protein 23-like n=1 Tax=Agrilus planipennis TaxID=224129 RepID=A0A1W4XQV7_AGRPL|nr:leucine-rich repeat-containing protein 23-like [Agrilus planipennis]
MAEDAGEAKSIPGEAVKELYYPLEEVIVEKRLTFEEAAKCLNTLGKDESGMRYAYLMITATDRKLTHVDIILNFKHVLFIDISGNYLTLDSLQILTNMPFLILLKAERNRMQSAALKPAPYLQLVIMKVLYNVTDNQVYNVQFVSEGLPELKQLELRGNFLPDFSGSFPTSIEKLYMAENRISKIISIDVCYLTNLKILHLRDNQIKKLNGFTEHLVNLEYLNLRQNRITKFREFRKLQCLPKLETLIVIANPVAGEENKMAGEEPGEEMFGEDQGPTDPVRIPLLVLLPNLKRINKMPVAVSEREDAYRIRDEKYTEIMAEDNKQNLSISTAVYMRHYPVPDRILKKVTDPPGTACKPGTHPSYIVNYDW